MNRGAISFCKYCSNIVQLTFSYMEPILIPIWAAPYEPNIDNDIMKI